MRILDPILGIRNSGSMDLDSGPEAPDSGSDDPVSGSEDPNPVLRILIPVLSVRILDSYSDDPNFWF